jgi:methylmalonyl-CoA/ethylmalonyl-CoA epimerase
MPNPALPQIAIHHVSISVPDMEAAIAWYGEIFGFAVEFRFDVEPLSAKGAFLKRAELRLELWQVGGGEPVPESRRDPNSDLRTGGTKHVAFAVPGLQARLVELAKRGVDIAAVQRHPTEPMLPDPDLAAAPGKRPAFAAFIRDPGGTLIELIDAALSQ